MMSPVSADDPMMIAWEAYKLTPEYANSRCWALHETSVDGSMWAAFVTGFQAAPAGIEALALSRVADWIRFDLPPGTIAATTMLGIVNDALAAAAPADPVSGVGEVDWNEPLPNALWEHFGKSYGLSNEEACEAAGEILDILAALSPSPGVKDKLVEALERIERWFGEFPETGEAHKNGEPVSYGCVYGSNGERDYMRSIARQALAAARQTEEGK